MNKAVAMDIDTAKSHDSGSSPVHGAVLAAGQAGLPPGPAFVQENT